MRASSTNLEVYKRNDTKNGGDATKGKGKGLAFQRRAAYPYAMGYPRAIVLATCSLSRNFLGLYEQPSVEPQFRHL